MTEYRIVVRDFGGPEQLLTEEITESLRPVSSQALIEVEAAGINYLDVYQHESKGPHKPPLPFYPGLEGVGRIRELGPDSPSTLQVGQRVAWINVPGSYATALAAPVDKLIPVPDDLSVPQALLFQALTAQYLVTEYRDIQPGDWVLVHAAAGGVGSLLVQWFGHLGARVIGTTSSDAKAQSIRAAGADAVVNYGHDYTFVDEVQRLTGGQGVQLAIDGIGAATLEKTLQCLARGGTAVSIGSASGPAPAIQPGVLTNRALRLAGGSVFTYTADPAELQQRAAAVIEGLQKGWLKVEQSTAFPLEQAADAHRALESRGTRGKLYLTTQE